MNMVKIFNTALAIVFANILIAQPIPPVLPTDTSGVTLEIINQEVIGTDFFFDVYLRHTTGTPGNFFLANGDFVLNFNSANFTNPVLTRVSNTCTFTPTNVVNAVVCRALYNANLSTTIIGNSLVINLNTVPANDQAELNDNIANINSTANTHRLSRFKVSGVTNVAGTAGLQWKRNLPNVFTDIYYYASNFNQYRAKLNAVKPVNQPLPLELTAVHAEPVNNQDALITWRTANEQQMKQFVVERLYNDQTWRAVEQVPALNTATEQAYKVLDQQVHRTGASATTLFYRLQMHEESGKISYSPTLAVPFSGTKQRINVFPNPTESGFELMLLNADGTQAEGTYQVRMTDATGRVYVDESRQVGQTQFTVEHWPAGWYAWQVIYDTHTFSGRLLKI
jgi:hypothetical protein